MLIGDMDISIPMVFIQQVEEENVKDIEEYRNNKAKTGMSLVKKRWFKLTTIR